MWRSGQGEQSGQDLALHGKRLVTGCLGVGLPQHSLRLRVDDDGGVRAMPRECDGWMTTTASRSSPCD